MQSLCDAMKKIPVSSLRSSGTLEAAKIMGSDPKMPLVRPRVREKRMGGPVPGMRGFARGAAHMSMSGMNTIRHSEADTNCLARQGYGIPANT